MKAVELFAGIGGFRLGLERNGINVIWANEFDRYAAETYDKNFYSNQGQERQGEAGSTKRRAGGSASDSRRGIEQTDDSRNHRIDRRDITTVDVRDIPGHDLLVGGFPCQAFSIAGKRHGFKETRGTLFFDVARILADKRPRHLVLENVKGLLTHDGGQTFHVILGVLADLGYRVEWQVLNSKNFGVPQNRERIYIVGHLRGECTGQIFPIGGNSEKDTRLIGQELSPTVDANYYKGWSPTGQQGKRRQMVQAGVVNRGAFKETGEHALTVTASYYKGHDNHGQRPMVITAQPKYGNGERSIKYKVTDQLPTIRATQHKRGDNEPLVLSQNQRREVRERTEVGALQTTRSASQFDVIKQDSARIRRLTPKECERLQGFPDNWTEGVSDTQRYKQCGNAVTVNVVDAVAKALVDTCLI